MLVTASRPSVTRQPLHVDLLRRAHNEELTVDVRRRRGQRGGRALGGTCSRHGTRPSPGVPDHLPDRSPSRSSRSRRRRRIPYVTSHPEKPPADRRRRGGSNGPAASVGGAVVAEAERAKKAPGARGDEGAACRCESASDRARPGRGIGPRFPSRTRPAASASGRRRAAPSDSDRRLDFRALSGGAHRTATARRNSVRKAR